MDELVKLISQKVGISEGAARSAVDTVAGYLKQRLPDPIAGQVDRVLAGGGGGGTEGLKDAMSGFLGKK